MVQKKIKSKTFINFYERIILFDLIFVNSFLIHIVFTE